MRALQIHHLKLIFLQGDKGMEKNCINVFFYT